MKTSCNFNGNTDLLQNEAAYKVLKEGGNSIDAAEIGGKLEDDPSVLSVGYGGLPDERGVVTLDAAIMDWRARIGSVICVENIHNPISLAGFVLEDTGVRTILAAGGAYDFALKNDFIPEKLTEESIKRFRGMEIIRSEESRGNTYG